MCKRNPSQSIYIAYKLSAMFLVSVELLWHETGRGEKTYLQGEILLRSHTRLSFSCLKMLDHLEGLVFRAHCSRKLLLLSTD